MLIYVFISMVNMEIGILIYSRGFHSNKALI